MARRRMFSLDIVDSDAFLDMSLSAQALYFHLGMRADDDGFVANPKKMLRAIGGNQNDYDLLLAKRFILPFQSGVCVIKHWKIHNYIQKDRYKETLYLEEKNSLVTKENGSYTDCIQDVSRMDTQVRLGKDSKGNLDSKNESHIIKKKDQKMSKKNSFRYKGESQHPEFEDAIDYDSGEEIVDTGEIDARKKVTELLEWGAKVRKKKFFDPVAQRAMINKMRAQKITPKQIKDAFLDALHSDFWKNSDRLPDFKTVYSNLKNKK